MRFESCISHSNIYSNAVIHEALRIHPNAGIILERIVPTPGAEIEGYHIPGGTIVGVNAWFVNFEKEIFGEDANDFRPERWLETDAERLSGMKRTLFSVRRSPPLPLLTCSSLTACSLEQAPEVVSDGILPQFRLSN